MTVAVDPDESSRGHARDVVTRDAARYEGHRAARGQTELNYRSSRTHLHAFEHRRGRPGHLASLDVERYREHASFSRIEEMAGIDVSGIRAACQKDLSLAARKLVNLDACRIPREVRANGGEQNGVSARKHGGTRVVALALLETRHRFRCAALGRHAEDTGLPLQVEVDLAVGTPRARRVAALAHGDRCDGLRWAASDGHFLQLCVGEETEPRTVSREERPASSLGSRNGYRFQLVHTSQIKSRIGGDDELSPVGGKRDDTAESQFSGKLDGKACNGFVVWRRARKHESADDDRDSSDGPW